MKIRVVAVGKIKGGLREACDEYLTRLNGSVVVREIPASSLAVESAAIIADLGKNTFAVILDERGQDLSSNELASRIEQWQAVRTSGIALVIGGGYGLSDAVKARADFTLGLGRKTWPHRLARVMLLEQLYRAHQITLGHPYHHE